MNWHKVAWIAFAIALVALQIALVAAKVGGYLVASWPLVLMPLWLPIVCFVVIVIIAIALLGGAAANGGNPFQ